jgi:hypothetical protein
MVAPKKCPGCLKPFTSQRAHHAQTSNPLCRQLAKIRKSSHLGLVCVPKHRPPRQPPHNSPPTLTNEIPSSPEQDAIRTPSPQLPDTPSDEDGWDDEDDEDGEDDYDVNAGLSSPGWEPPVSNGADNMSVSSDNTDSRPSPSPPPEGLRKRTWVTPQVVKFPNPHAGEPVRSVDSTNNAYAALLGGNSNSNPYSPFVSKIDWEVAKWAKVQVLLHSQTC